MVLIVADDHGPQLGCYGNREVKTPHLDALAREGTRFDAAFCTTASCSPSRSVILSGLHTHTSGQYGLQHAAHKQAAHPWVQGLPNLLRAAGYRTALCGKYHVGPEASFRFDTQLQEGTMGSRSAVRMAENAAAWIRSSRQPFFLYFCPSDPHRAVRGFANDREYPGVQPVKYDPAAVTVPAWLPQRPEVRQELAEYYESISRLDQGVGRLMRALEETGRRDETLVLYLSDNGPPFPGAKTTLYEPGIRLPLLARVPGGRAGGVRKEMVSWADIAPTVLEWTGAKGPEYALHGTSFLALARGEDAARPDEVFGSHQFHEITMYYPSRMLRTRRHKLILNLAHPLPFPFASDLYHSPTWQGVLQRADRDYGRRTVSAYVNRPKWELYDLEADPDEVRNLSDDAAQAATLTDLQSRLRAWQERTGDPWLHKYRYE